MGWTPPPRPHPCGCTCDTCRTYPAWFVKAVQAHQQNVDYICGTPPQPRFPCPACGKETKEHHEGTRICSNRNCRKVIAKKPDPYPPLSWIPDDAPAKHKRKIELLEQRLKQLEHSLPTPTPPVPRPTHCDCPNCLAIKRERAAEALDLALLQDHLHLLVEWVELKREVALVCRLWWAWFGSVW